MIVHGGVVARGTTRLFVRADASGEHVFACDLEFTATTPVTVVVPIPVAPGGHVSFLDLQHVPTLFDDLEEHFALPRRRHDDQGDDDDDDAVVARDRSGVFTARLVPSLADLDDEFRGAVKDHVDDAFAVFRFHGSAPPFGFRFLPRDGALFFPTRHASDGVVDAAVVFDHALYLQGLPLQTGWHKSRKKTQARTAPQLSELVDDNQWLRRRRITGPHENVDVWVALAQPTQEPRPVPALSFIEQMGLDVLSVSDNDLWGLDDEDDSPETVFMGLERRLVDPRSRIAAAEELLAPDFEEIGASGVHYDRAATLSAMKAQPTSLSTSITELATAALSEELTLVTFRTQNSRRSSLWKKTPAGWRLRFHQGTPLR